jgi:hypothetical protein
MCDESYAKYEYMDMRRACNAKYEKGKKAKNCNKRRELLARKLCKLQADMSPYMPQSTTPTNKPTKSRPSTPPSKAVVRSNRITASQTQCIKRAKASVLEQFKKCVQQRVTPILIRKNVAYDDECDTDKILTIEEWNDANPDREVLPEKKRKDLSSYSNYKSQITDECSMDGYFMKKTIEQEPPNRSIQLVLMDDSKDVPSQLTRSCTDDFIYDIRDMTREGKAKLFRHILHGSTVSPCNKSILSINDPQFYSDLLSSDFMIRCGSSPDDTESFALLKYVTDEYVNCTDGSKKRPNLQNHPLASSDANHVDAEELRIEKSGKMQRLSRSERKAFEDRRLRKQLQSKTVTMTNPVTGKAMKDKKCVTLDGHLLFTCGVGSKLPFQSEEYLYLSLLCSRSYALGHTWVQDDKFDDTLNPSVNGDPVKVLDISDEKVASVVFIETGETQNIQCHAIQVSEQIKDTSFKWNQGANAKILHMALTDLKKKSLEHLSKYDYVTIDGNTFTPSPVMASGQKILSMIDNVAKALEVPFVLTSALTEVISFYYKSGYGFVSRDLEEVSVEECFD